MDFVVPDSPFDLEVAKAGRVYVHAVLDVEGCADIDAVLQRLSDRLLGGADIFAAVLDADTFDALYSLVKCVCRRSLARRASPPPHGH